jgi:MGT family glycosyltransferase
MDAHHIAFINFPYAPHVNPNLPIVSALTRRGYRVTFVTSENFSSAVAEAGGEVVPCRPVVVDAKAAALDPDFERLGPYSQRMLEDITPFYDANRPSLVLYDFMALAGRILVKRLGVPAIQTSPFYGFLEDDFAGQVKHEVFRTELLNHAENISLFLDTYGIRSLNYRVDKERLNLYLFPRALQPRGAEFGEHCYFAGRCPGERVVRAHWEDQSGGRPIALVSMTNLRSTGTSMIEVPAHFSASIDALSGLGWHIVLSLNERCDRSLLHPLPPHCEIIHPSALLKVLARARVLFFNSGIMTTAEAAYHGVPMAAITEGHPEFEWQGERIAELGIGVHIRKEAMNSANLREAAIRLSSDRMLLDRVRQIKREVRREPGAEEVADRIEEYIHALA